MKQTNLPQAGTFTALATGPYGWTRPARMRAARAGKERMKTETTSKSVASKAGKALASIPRIRKAMNRLFDAMESIAASALTQAADKPAIRDFRIAAKRGKWGKR